ncbi:Multidrug resistance protein [Desulfonema limicola]|uniref:Multidrug resistance protein n=1 Tax=Desulfonema limicola TaxID=45656 RepID=A0A975B9I4_9BACT|nr:efflux RND transporter permease subunit [Desulfonema limicola]QTA81152.1 Multidrug resistance protein [Desulfonema limicola]
MDYVRYSIEKPVTVAVAVIMVVMFGIIGLKKLPVQLTPDVEEPKITVRTLWAGATPYEIEKEIIEKQEDVLKGVKNLIKMESSSYNNYGEISLTFKVGTDLDNSLLRVSNKLNEVSGYPENTDNPSIDAAGAQSSPVIWTMLKMKSGDPSEIVKYQTFFENEIRQKLERVQGVGALFVGGGIEKQLHIIVDTEKMARHNVTINEVIAKVRGANKNESAGILGVGKKDYRLRTTSQFENVEDPLDVVIFDNGVSRVKLGDIARTEYGYEKPSVSVMQNAVEGIVVAVRKEPGTNVIELISRLKAVVDDLNENLLADNNLYLHWIYDEAPYINKAIDIVKQNVVIGGLLAICVLLVFLRSLSATITTAVAIPISAMGTFIFLWIFNRNFNVVSLAGISFAVGMLVDNSIVVLENIDRHRKMGKQAFSACYDGAKEVWGAVFASTVTTVAVFVPVIFIEQESGQLFRDIAIAITFSIILSLFVSVGVIPSVLNQFYKRRPLKTNNNNSNNGIISRTGSFFAGAIMFLSDFFLKNTITRLACILIFTFLSLSLVAWLVPKAEYLPQGNRNLVLGILIPPPGSSVEKRKAVGNYIYEQAGPNMKEDNLNGIPRIKEMFYVGTTDLNLFGAVSAHDTRGREMLPLFNRIINSIPDMFGISIQAGIFQSDIGGGRSIDVNIAGEKLEDIIAAARVLYGGIMGKVQGSQVRPVPSLEISYPEVNIIPDKEKLAASGLTESELGIYADILMDGRKIDEFKPEGIKQIDLVLKGDDLIFQTPEDILSGLIVNRYGNLIRIGDVSTLKYTQGMTQVNHLERKRTIKLQVTPPADMPLQGAIETIENDLISPMIKSGTIKNVNITIGGNADKLIQTREALQWNFLLAIVITYLLMSALFENFFYPFIILFTIPLAAAGGFAGLSLVNIFIAPQGFDVLTMLGFIILVGTVVNNAILIVHQSLNNVRYEDMEGVAAISESVKTRIRPIFMSAATSILGLFPLVVSTGSGSELYRGLGSVLLGGLALSTIFTLFVIPSFLAFFIIFEKSRQ